MKHRYLEVTFRRGRPLAAYLHLPRKVGEKSVRTVPMGHGLAVDYNADGKPIGMEITAHSHVTIAQVDEILRQLGFEATTPDELAPLRAAQRTSVGSLPQATRTGGARPRRAPPALGI
jgi:uncharacterized protein YuzE